MNPGVLLKDMHWLGHSSFRWEGSRIVYFDPWKISKGAKPADVVLVSHEHFDHCSRNDVALIATKGTVIVASEAASRELEILNASCKEMRVMVPDDEIEVLGVKIKATASYNIGKAFHPKAGNGLGFIVTMDGVSVYHAGDTDLIPEMKNFRCDIALLPVSGTYVMSADEAAEAAINIKPKVAVPMHYAEIVGSAADANRLRELLKGKVEVEMLKKRG